LKDFFSSLAKSFLFAFRGLFYMIKTERNFRIHLIAIVYVVLFAMFYGLDRTQTAILILTFFTVPALELVNTAIENTVDIKTKEINSIAGRAKDIAAAAVLFAAITAVVIGICLFSDKDRFLAAIQIALTPPWLIIIAVSIVPAYLFVRGNNKKKNKKKNKTENT